MKDFRDFKVWEKAHELVLEIYKCTADFPKQELVGLVTQCAVAVRPSKQTLPKVAAVSGTPNSTVFCKSHAGRQMNWSTTFYWPKISAICQKTNTRSWTRDWQK